MFFDNARILVLAPHTDDAELGAGASISKWIRNGSDVHYVAFSACESIQPSDVDPGILRVECHNATEHLGLARSAVRVLDFEVRQFERDRQRLLDCMVDLSRELQPDLVLLPSSDDTHQDHVAVSTEARRAFKFTRMLGYEAPWNNFRFETSAFVRVDQQDADRKIESLAMFKSQSDRNYMSADYQRAQLLFRGMQSGGALAEAFQVLRWFL